MAKSSSTGRKVGGNGLDARKDIKAIENQTFLLTIDNGIFIRVYHVC